MAFKLSKADRDRRDEIIAKLLDLAASVESATDYYNNVVGMARGMVEAALENYNEAIQEASEFRDDVVSQAEDNFAEKSEKWQEGDRGQAAEAWKSEWEGLELNEVEIDFPDELSFDDPDPASALQEAPEALEAV